MSGQIEMAKRWTKDSENRLLVALKFVPDDKLNWSPTATAKSALKIAAHAGVVNQGMAMGLSGQSMPDMTMEKMMAFTQAEEAKITSREQAIGLIESSTAAVMSALDKIPADSLGTTAQTPFGPIPMESFILLPSLHCDCHSSQIDYLQTTWGDMDMHM